MHLIWRIDTKKSLRLKHALIPKRTIKNPTNHDFFVQKVLSDDEISLFVHVVLKSITFTIPRSCNISFSLISLLYYFVFCFSIRNIILHVYMNFDQEQYIKCHGCKTHTFLCFSYIWSYSNAVSHNVLIVTNIG
jgi:hypothetical protein